MANNLTAEKALIFRITHINNVPWILRHGLHCKNSDVQEALLHKSAEGRSSPFPGQTYPVTSVMGVPSAVKPLRTATRTWNSAT